jgi:hypothetical protein
MKLAVLSESSADEAAIRIIVEGILGQSTEEIALQRLRSRGWPSVKNVLPAVMARLQYQTEAEALVLIVDSDDSPVHKPAHEEPGAEDVDCRLCQLRTTVAQVRNRLSVPAIRSALKIGIGVAVPSIEAWLCCGINPHVNEATWRRHLQGEQITYNRKSLKVEVYGTDHPSLETLTNRGMEASRLLVNDLVQLETLFPNGFGHLAREVRTWR